MSDKADTKKQQGTISDETWALLEPCFAEVKQKRGPQARPDRVIFQAILDHMWSDVPLRHVRSSGQGKSKRPSHDTLASRAKHWKRAGVLAKAAEVCFKSLDEEELAAWIKRIHTLDGSGKSWPDWLLVLRDATKFEEAQRVQR